MQPLPAGYKDVIGKPCLRNVPILRRDAIDVEKNPVWPGVFVWLFNSLGIYVGIFVSVGWLRGPVFISGGHPDIFSVVLLWRVTGAYDGEQGVDQCQSGDDESADYGERPHLYPAVHCFGEAQWNQSSRDGGDEAGGRDHGNADAGFDSSHRGDQRDESLNDKEYGNPLDHNLSPMAALIYIIMLSACVEEGENAG